MTFNPAAAISILEILKNTELPDKDLVIDLGSQRYTAQRIYPANSTRDFYLKNGFKEYLALDINDTEFTVKADLNEPFELGRQASLVTNIGTSEHIFDQGRVFENMHNLCKVGGIMFFHLPFTPWLNHGFYNYNPILFEALATANKYALGLLQVGDREGVMIDLPYEEIVKERGQFALEGAARAAQRPSFIFAVFKKTTDESFKKPFQKRYVQDIADEQILQRYK